jgi:hypothetical protein
LLGREVTEQEATGSLGRGIGEEGSQEVFGTFVSRQIKLTQQALTSCPAAREL